MFKKLSFLFAIVFMMSFSSAALTDNILSAWLLDDDLATTNVVDEVSNYDGTLNVNTNTISTTGKLNKAFHFDGTNDRLDTGIVADWYGTATIDMWVKLDTISGAYLTSKTHAGSGGKNILLNSDGTVGIAWDTGLNTAQTTATLSTDTWYHIVGTWEAGTNNAKIYINGVLRAEGTLGTETTNSDTARIGGRWATLNSGNAVMLDGIVDNVNYWNRALTDGDVAVDGTATGEVGEIYNSGTGLAYPFVTDTCSCPGVATNWEISLADYCNITTVCNITTGNITFINNGTVMFNSTLTANKITFKDSVNVIEKYNLGSIFKGWFG